MSDETVDISKAPTKFLVEELEKRGGVKTTIADSEYAYVSNGPATVIVFGDRKEKLKC